jgi:hypothetical protein
MKIAYFAESTADAAALAILTDAILGIKTEDVPHGGFRHRGWPAVRNVLPAVLKELHYSSDAEGLVMIVDSNGKPPHSKEHEPPNVPEPECRLCQLRRIADEFRQHVSPRLTLPPLKIALGLAVPAIEAWLLCGVDSHVTEAAWINGLQQRRGPMPYTKSELKVKLYGTSHPSLDVETEAMKKAASRLAADYSSLERFFPGGFGPLRDSLKSW